MNKIKDKVPYPSDWKIKKLGELGSFLKGKGISKSETKESGLPCIRYGEIYTRHHNYIKEFYSFIDEETAKNSTEIRKGDILFAGSGETMEEIGKSVAFIHEEKAYAGGDIIILRTKDVDSQYLAFALNEGRLAKERAKLGQGHSVVHIYPKELKELIIHLPSNIEQQKIASILSTWDKAIELKEKLIEQKKEQKKGLMQKLLTGEVRLPGFNEKWEKVRLGNICSITTGKLDANAMKENGKYKFFTCAKEVYSIDEYAFDTEALLVSGNGANVGYIHYYNGKFNAYQRTYVLDQFSNNILFIKYLLDKNLKRRIHKEKNAGNTPYITLGTLSDMYLSLPSKVEQYEIAKILEKSDYEIDLLEKDLEYVKQQKQGLMQLLLTGKVRVKV